MPTVGELLRDSGILDWQVIPPKSDIPNGHFIECVEIILRYEGGFVNDPDDPGGATNFGITLATLRSWRNDTSLQPKDVRAMPVSEAKAIYQAKYWNAVSGDLLPRGLDLAVFDFGVNSGVSRASKMLQNIVGVPEDGVIGPITLEAVKRKNDPLDLVEELCEGRLDFVKGLKNWPKFGRGWSRRIEEICEEARRMCVGG